MNHLQVIDIYHDQSSINNDCKDENENDEENGKITTDNLSYVGKLLTNDVVSIEMQSNSDSDNNDVSGLDDSNDKLSDGSDFIDDFDDDLNNPNDSDKKPIESIHTSIHISPISSEQIKVEDNNKTKEAMQAIKSNVMSLSSTSSCSSETIAEDEVRTLLLRKQHMIFTELIQYFLTKAENLSSEEIKNGIVQKLSKILRHLNIEEKTINGEKHIQLKLFN